MRGHYEIRDFERWLLRRRNASVPQRVNLLLVAEDEGTLRRFGIWVTEYLNDVDDAEHGGWFLIDDELIESLCCQRSSVESELAKLDQVFLNGGAVIVCSRMGETRRAPGTDVHVLLTGGEGGGGEGGQADISLYHATVNAVRLPERMVVCLVGDVVLEWSYRLGRVQ